jgi:spore coat polysaccharide biosynthesis protein SpsF
MSSASSIVILQARMASRRFPGKALKWLGDRPVLVWCLERLRAGVAGPVVVATTSNPEDDILEEVAERCGAPVFRGPDRDVLRRFVLAADRFGATSVVRATADNPAVDIDAPLRVLELLLRTGADYVVEVDLPHGTAVEAVSVEALVKADAIATDADDREHVTPLLRRDRRLFNALQTAAPGRLRRPDLRLTIDTPEDLWFMERVVAELGCPAPESPLGDIIVAADRVSLLARGAIR